MTLTLTPKTEAMLLARAEGEGQDANVLGNALLSGLLAHDEAKPSEEPAMVTEAGVMSGEIRAAAKVLADAAREADPETLKVLLFPAADEVRLLYVDSTARPTFEDEAIVPFYFGPDPRNGIHYPFAVTLIRPEEEGRLRLPDGWGTWEDAAAI
jgi:hypothetical protein